MLGPVTAVLVALVTGGQVGPPGESPPVCTASTAAAGELRLDQTKIRAAGSSTARSLEERFAETLNIKDFGAVGDGQSDDGAAIQEALDRASQGGTVFVPPGVYNIGSTTLHMDGSPRLLGSGMTRSVIKYTGDLVALKVNSGRGTTTHGWTIADLGIDGAQRGGVGIALGQTATSPLSAGGRVERIMVTGFKRAQLQLEASQIVSVVASQFSAYNRTGDGIEVIGTGNTNTLTSFTSCKFIESRRGAKVEQYVDLSFHNCQFEQNDEEGLLVRKLAGTAVTRHLTIANNYFENNNRAHAREAGKAQLKVTSLAAGGHSSVNIIGNFFQNGINAEHFGMSLGKGHFLVEDNDFNGHSSGQLHAEDSAACSVVGRGSKSAATMWSTSTGRAAHILWMTTEPAVWSTWDEGVWRPLLDLEPPVGRRLEVGSGRSGAPDWQGGFTAAADATTVIYRDPGETVHLVGTVRGTVGEGEWRTIFTLPKGYRPGARVTGSASSAERLCLLEIGQGGDVRIRCGRHSPGERTGEFPVNIQFPRGP